MDSFSIACVLATFFFAAFLKGTAGLGFATTSLGIMAAYMDMRLAIPLVILPSLLANFMVMADAGGFGRVWRKFRLMYAAAVPGLFAGLWLLGESDGVLPRTAPRGLHDPLRGVGTCGAAASSLSTPGSTP